jgi:glycosyltransferase involved in cell wall biosynthesis
MNDRPSVLMLAHFPPPVHGVAAVSEAVLGAAELHRRFRIRAVPIQLSSGLDQIGRFGLRKPLRILHMLAQTARAWRAARPQLVYMTLVPHGGGFYACLPLIALLRLLRARVVYHLHGKGIGAVAARSPLYRRLFGWAMAGGSVILLSPRLVADAAGLLPERRIYFLPNYGPEPAPEPASRDGGHILFLSNLVESKGPLVLLDALALLQARGCAFRARFTGIPFPPLSAHGFAAEIAARGLAGQVDYVGPVYGADKAALIASADIFAFPTMNDAFPLSLLEAMAGGLAVVTTPEGAIPDMVEHGVTGLLVPQGDATALATALATLLADPLRCRRMGAAGQARVRERFSRERFFAGMAEIWSTVMKGPA